MEAMFSGETVVAWLEAFWFWLSNSVFTSTMVVFTAMQIPAVVGTGFAAWWVHDFIYPVVEHRVRHSKMTDYGQHVLLTLASLLFPALWTAGLWLSTVVAVAFYLPRNVIWITINLLVAWIVIRLASILARDPVWSRTIAILVYAVAALNILHLLGPTLALLDQLAVTIGQFRLSMLTVLRGMVSLGVLLWAAMIISKILERRVYRLPNLTPSIQVLLGKLLKATLVTLAIIIALTSIGVDVTAVAVFSGALGLGIGFGLQKIVSNMISGVILLMDRSIKPGDIIQIGGTYGWISSLGTRYVSIETRDGTEFLVPNEDIITQQVVNWSHRNDLARLKVQVQVPFDSDLEQALALLVEAARKPARVLPQPAPRALVLDFSEGRAELEVRFWIHDVQNGIRNVSGEVRLEIWRLFRAHGLSLPAPRRDISICAFPSATGAAQAPAAVTPARLAQSAFAGPEPGSP